jgi:hypothetical protein
MIDARQAALELDRRDRAVMSLCEYSQSIDIPGVPHFGERDEDPILDGWERESPDQHIIEKAQIQFLPIEQRVALHHYVMMEFIQDVIVTPRGRGMVFAPPGSAKSTYGSVVGPSWAMGRKRNQQVILGSYATGIAAKQSRKVRAIVKSPGYGAIWKDNPQLLDDQRAVDDWQLTNGSGLMAAGLLAGITGNRADGFVIDDPIANREQADSSTIREKIYSEYIDTVMTRDKPTMWCLIIQTRWHEDDLAGAILPANYEGESGRIHCRDGQWWNVLCIPAKAERDDDPLGRKKGEYLWPEWFPRDHWRTWEDNPRAARTWGALYQQRPAPLSGIHFNREMFKLYDPDLPRL